MVEDDDPDTTDVVETREETWYIYTFVYNGEGYFANTVFHLTDDQKSLADDYAENLSLFLGGGMFQYTEYGGSTITALGDVRFTDGITEVVYFNQLDERYANKPYGTDNIGGYGCGPTSMSIVVSSLTNDIADPIEMMVADPASTTRSVKLWDLSIILNAASKRARAGGPFWIVGR